MDAGTSLVAIIGIVGTFMAPIILFRMWLHRPSVRNGLPSRSANADAALEARLERIEVAVQAIALETERIAEGQRFTTKLLAASAESTPARL